MNKGSHQFSYVGARPDNQDSVGRLEMDGYGAYIVADGLGGHQQGRLASNCAVSVLLNGLNAGKTCETDTLASLIKDANDTILQIQKDKNCITKSTVVALVIQGETAFWANTGDSRLYYLHDGTVRQITEDHSVAYKKYKGGEITKDEIASDEDQSSLLRTLGGVNRWEPDTGTIDHISPEDGFMLCSDGVWEYLRDEEILIDFLKSGSAAEWASFMLLRINDRLPPDNDNLSMITVAT